jgi:hypothetical protein
VKPEALKIVNFRVAIEYLNTPWIRVNFPDDPVIKNATTRYIYATPGNVQKISEGVLDVNKFGFATACAYLNLYERNQEIIRCENLPVQYLAQGVNTINTTAGLPGGRMIPLDIKIDVYRSYLMLAGGILFFSPKQYLNLIFYLVPNGNSKF